MTERELNLLLLSSSRVGGGGYLDSARQLISDLFASCQRILFIPFAGVTISHADYGQKVRAALPALAERIHMLNLDDDGPETLASCDGVMVGGGNTFALLDRLYRHALVRELRDAVTAGMPYVGWSAGSNIAGPTIRTTNDMPIIEPPSLAALNLVPFQLNPHYTRFVPANFHGETRRERLAEFMVANPDSRVLALPEGCGLRVQGNDVTVVGDFAALELAADGQDLELAVGQRFHLNG